MLDGRARAIPLEDPGYEKAEFVVDTGAHREFHQAKRDQRKGKWSLSSLASAEGLLQAMGRTLSGNQDRFVLVSSSDSPELRDLSYAAKSAESETEFDSKFLESADPGTFNPWTSY